MKKIGITGAFCSGLEKTSEILNSFNYPVFEADLAIKFMLNWREDIVRNIRIQFGHNILNSGFVAPEKFATNEKFNRLLDVVEHELFRVLWPRFMNKHRNASVVFFKSHIIFERKWEKKFDEVVTVTKPKETRIKELLKILDPKISHQNFQTIQSKIEFEYTDTNRKMNSDYNIVAYDNLSMLTQFECIRSMLDPKLIEKKII